MNVKKLLSALALSSIALIATPALADDDNDTYQAQKQGNIISPEQAAQAAKARITGATVTDVDFEYSSFRGAHYDVEVVDSKGREYTVIVDAKTGKVVSSYRDY